MIQAHAYDNLFFDYINEAPERSAPPVAALRRLSLTAG
jgi:hypothetical protein